MKIYRQFNPNLDNKKAYHRNLEIVRNNFYNKDNNYNKSFVNFDKNCGREMGFEEPIGMGLVFLHIFIHK